MTANRFTRVEDAEIMAEALGDVLASRPPGRNFIELPNPVVRADMAPVGAAIDRMREQIARRDELLTELITVLSARQKAANSEMEPLADALLLLGEKLAAQQSLFVKLVKVLESRETGKAAEPVKRKPRKFIIRHDDGTETVVAEE